MLTQKSATPFAARSSRTGPADRDPALGLETVLWFAIATLLAALLAYASVRHGIVAPGMMD